MAKPRFPNVARSVDLHTGSAVDHDFYPAVIALGLAIAVFFGVRSMRSFRELQYIHQQGLDRGTASVDAIRPWMTIRFIAVAYAVPEEYLYSALAIPFERRNADQPLGELNKIYQLGLVPNSTELVIIDKAKAVITEYRKNPVATGLRVAGGAFIQQGVLDPYTTIALGLLGVVLGDTLSYGMGRLLRHPIQRRYGQSAAWIRAEAYFARRAALAVYLTRCVLTPIAVPINLIAGSSDYPLGHFVAYDAAGERTWLLGYGALGYLFGSQWEYVSDLISNASGLLVGLAIAGAGAYALIGWQRRPAPEPIAPPS